MPDGVRLSMEAETLAARIDELVDALRRDGCQLAQDNRDYRVLRGRRTAELRAQKIPVTIITDLVLGMEDVADARMQRDMSEVLYKTDFEAINAGKLHLRMVKDQIDREWGRGQ